MFNTLMSVGQTQKYIINSSLIFQSLCILFFFFFQRGLLVTMNLELLLRLRRYLYINPLQGHAKGVTFNGGSARETIIK